MHNAIRLVAMKEGRQTMHFSGSTTGRVVDRRFVRACCWLAGHMVCEQDIWWPVGVPDSAAAISWASIGCLHGELVRTHLDPALRMIDRDKLALYPSSTKSAVNLCAPITLFDCPHVLKLRQMGQILRKQQ